VLIREGRRRAFKGDTGQPVQPHLLDHRAHGGLRIEQPQRAAVNPEPSRQDGDVEHQRGVAEHQLAKVHHDVTAGVDRAGESPSPEALRRPVLVSSTAQHRGVVIELDDRGNLQNRAGGRKAAGRNSGHQRANALGHRDDLARLGAPSAAYTRSAMPTVEAVTDALRDVIDPELGLDFVELGLIYDVEVEGGTVRVTYTLTSPGCPIGPQVSEQIEEFVSELDGVQDVQPTMTFTPPWTPDRMSEDAKFALGF
jgi:metal-sulfur cluster biosynthetic enzyme